MFIINDEDRKNRRTEVPLPVSVEIDLDLSTHWIEESIIEDVSHLGAGFTLKRPVKRGRLVQLTIPMPKAFRRYDFSKDDYCIWGIVRRCIEINKPDSGACFAVGVGFIGKDPPPEYSLDPTRLYELSHVAPDGDGFWTLSDGEPDPDEEVPIGEVERETRLQIPEDLILELLDENGDVVASERTVSENVSIRGASVFTQFDAVIGSFVRVTSERHNVTLISIIHDQRVGADGIMRLHLEFIDMLFPLDGLN